MQVFVPFESFTKSVQVLDRSRLQKQIVECHQILGAILGWPTKDGKARIGYLNHAAVIGWRYHPRALAQYALCAVAEMEARGYKRSCYHATFCEVRGAEDVALAPWIGDEAVHSSHRARLLQKDFDYYSQFGWPETLLEDLTTRQYQWPIFLIGSETEYRLEERVSKRSKLEQAAWEATCASIRKRQQELGAYGRSRSSWRIRGV
jgi:hypothetical protein